VFVLMAGAFVAAALGVLPIRARGAGAGPAAAGPIVASATADMSS
jgi:hypothetical protein